MPNLTTTEKCQLIERMSHFIPHASLQGIRLEQIDGEEITFRLPYRAALVGNPETGAMHSGVITVLLDHTLGMAGICCDRVGAVLTPTLDLRIDHLGIAPAGRDILATARVYRATRRILLVEGFAYCESRDRPVARAARSPMSVSAPGKSTAISRSRSRGPISWCLESVLQLPDKSGAGGRSTG